MSGNDSDPRVIEVLLVEDNPVDARIFREILKHGADTFNITSVSSLADALAELRSKSFGAVVIDLNLPDSKGLDTLKAVRAASELPIIVVTATADEAMGFEALRLGAQDFLMKPDVNARVLPRALRYAIERHRLQGQLEQSQRIARLGNVAGSLAHNFNNVLMGIQPHAELVKRAGKDNPRIVTSIENIETSLKRGKALTTEILRFTRPTAPRIAPIRVSEVFAALQLEFPMLVVEQTDLGVPADREQLIRALGNLVRNGFEAKSEGGTVKIAARAVESGVQFEVTDTSGGIAPETRARLFDPLFTTKRHAAGLGLAAVQQIADAHGGTIEIESTMGEGTTARLTIPHHFNH